MIIKGQTSPLKQQPSNKSLRKFESLHRVKLPKVSGQTKLSKLLKAITITQDDIRNKKLRNERYNNYKLSSKQKNNRYSSSIPRPHSKLQQLSQHSDHNKGKKIQAQLRLQESSMKRIYTQPSETKQENIRLLQKLITAKPTKQTMRTTHKKSFSQHKKYQELFRSRKKSSLASSRPKATIVSFK